MDDGPDIFDLEEWAAEHMPQLLKAIHYLHEDARYSALCQVWRDAGRPAFASDILNPS